MAQKIFVSYKYADNHVYKLWGNTWKTCTPNDYLQKFIELADKNDFMIYKGEKPNEDLSHLSEARIWEILKEKIFDSTLTIVFISPNMNDTWKREKDQWIPREIVYSVREQSRSNQNSLPNALLYVVLPDANNSYSYFHDRYSYFKPFSILKANLDNGYAHVVNWNTFIGNMKNHINIANEKREKISPVKQISGEFW